MAHVSAEIRLQEAVVRNGPFADSQLDTENKEEPLSAVLKLHACYLGSCFWQHHRHYYALFTWHILREAYVRKHIVDEISTVLADREAR